jgi:sodium/potassium-transporting ATPase subunit alpha
MAEREVIGDATETALFRYTSAVTDIDTLRQKLPHAVEVPFNSDRKWAAGVFDKPHATGVYTVYLKVISILRRNLRHYIKSHSGFVL